MRNLIRLLTLLLACVFLSARSAGDQTRRAESEDDLRFWLQNMVWHHRYSESELRDVTGLDPETLRAKLQQFNISAATRPERSADQLLMLPYPGGRHPRIGFLDGAIDPQRDTKLSIFCPWDETSYVVADIPEAIFSNLGLTYLAHTHVETLWTRQGIELEQTEWERRADGSLLMRRRLPNGIEFGTVARARKDHIQMDMWLRNGTPELLSGLRVQNCIMLAGAQGFAEQTDARMQFEGEYAMVRAADAPRWIITAWTPLQRAWGNPPCPCIHSDPQFPDCAPGETQWLRGWLSFYEGDDLAGELQRIRATGWTTRPTERVSGNLTGRIVDAETGQGIPARLSIQNQAEGTWHHAETQTPAGTAVNYRKQLPGTASVEMHTTLSADPFVASLPPGTYRLRVEHGKEYLPFETDVQLTEAEHQVTIPLRRFADMPARGWYSGDTHVHRTMEELPNAVLAEDVHVTFPLNYWVRDSGEIPSASGPNRRPIPDHVDATHVIWPVNTEYEIFTVNRRRHTQGAVFVLNHQTPLHLPAPPVRPIAEEARRQGGLLDLDKHSWNWSLMIIPIMDVDLFELTNNHLWRTQFGFPAWTIENAPRDWPEIQTDEAGFTELGWTEFGLQTYYALLNCGFRLRVSGGTASGVHPVPLGHGRVYVHTGDTFSYDAWVRGLDAGHSFVTNGPLLDVRFNDALPGTTWTRAETSNEVRIQGRIDSVAPLSRIQIIRNGVIAAELDAQTAQTESAAYRVSIDHTIRLSGSGWVAVRCFEDLPGDKVSFAHTNPVFVDVEGHPLRPRIRDVSYMLRRMDEEIQRNEGVLTDAAMQEYSAAREIYQKLLQQARPN